MKDNIEIIIGILAFVFGFISFIFSDDISLSWRFVVSSLIMLLVIFIGYIFSVIKNYMMKIIN